MNKKIITVIVSRRENEFLCGFDEKLESLIKVTQVAIGPGGVCLFSMYREEFLELLGKGYFKGLKIQIE